MNVQASSLSLISNTGFTKQDFPTGKVSLGKAGRISENYKGFSRGRMVFLSRVVSAVMHFRTLVLLILAWQAGSLAGGAEPAPTRWETGAALSASLDSPLSLTWDNTPLGQALASLASAYHVAIVLDRRVDPNQPLKLTISQQSLRTTLEQIAEHLKLGYSQLGPVAYLGPGFTAARLRTLAALRQEEAKRLPPAISRKLLAARGWQWAEASEPRNLLEQLAAEAGLTISGADRVPHDLWPAADLPSLSWLERMTLLAGQFDLTFRIDGQGKSIELVPIPQDVSLARTYRGNGQAGTLAKRWAEELPDARFKVEGDRVRVTGRSEDHERIEARLRPKAANRRAVADGQQVYQLNVEQKALDKVVDQLAARLNLQIRWDRAAIEAAGIRTDQLVSVKVSDAGLDELLKQLFQKTGLTFEREERNVTVSPTR